jgi:hypothetical protein
VRYRRRPRLRFRRDRPMREQPPTQKREHDGSNDEDRPPVHGTKPRRASENRRPKVAVRVSWVQSPTPLPSWYLPRFGPRLRVPWPKPARNSPKLRATVKGWACKISDGGSPRSA